ncbi:hypothetical protein [Paraburkholderia silvatlantica]|uniref:hypothetical protein n=1 Tax=Paraburkholderia silvatlantica TaxID=321895 RepID=UPI0015E8D5F3|nr:hypothetical protein [Paraburkholderia silvatlantica]
MKPNSVVSMSGNGATGIAAVHDKLLILNFILLTPVMYRQVQRQAIDFLGFSRKPAYTGLLSILFVSIRIIAVHLRRHSSTDRRVARLACRATR